MPCYSVVPADSIFPTRLNNALYCLAEKCLGSSKNRELSILVAPDPNSIIIEAGLASGETGMPIYQVDLKPRQAVMLPRSEGLHVPVVSPDGRYMVAASGNNHKLMLFDFRSGRWSNLTRGAPPS
jgi:hypothetical protein